MYIIFNFSILCEKCFDFLRWNKGYSQKVDYIIRCIYCYMCYLLDSNHENLNGLQKRCKLQRYYDSHSHCDSYDPSKWNWVKGCDETLLCGR